MRLPVVGREGVLEPRGMQLVPHVDLPLADAPVRQALGRPGIVAEAQLCYDRVLTEYGTA